MNKTLYLHLGFHKTGTTSFQHYCASNRDLLLEHGITYPKFSAKPYRQDLPSEFENHSVPLFSLLTSRPSQYHFNITHKIEDQTLINQTYFNQLSRQLKTSKNFLVSGEDLATLEPSEIISLCKLAEEEGYRIVPFALVRSPYALLNSAIQEQIKNGIHWGLVGLGNIVPPSFNQADPLRNDLTRIKNLREIFGDSMQFIPYSSACNHPDGLIGYLLSEIIGISNIDNKESLIKPCKNSSRSNLWVRLQNQVNSLQPVILNNKPNPSHYKIKYFSDNLDQKFLLSEQEFKLIEDKFSEIHNKLTFLLPNIFFEEEMRFSDPINSAAFIEEISKQLADI